MIYVFDLDGTLCTQHGRDYELAQPLPERIALVNQLYDEGHTIVIDSARGSQTGRPWKWKTKHQLRDWGVKYHTLQTGQKAAGDLYVDDRGMNAADFFRAEAVQRA